MAMLDPIFCIADQNSSSALEPTCRLVARRWCTRWFPDGDHWREAWSPWWWPPLLF